MGDLVAAVEGEPTAQFTPKQVLVCLKKAERPLELGFRRRNPAHAATLERAAAEKAFAEARRQKHRDDAAAAAARRQQQSGKDGAGRAESATEGQDGAAAAEEEEGSGLRVVAPSAAAAARRRREKAAAAERLRQRPRVFFEVMADRAVLGRLEFELFGDVTPRTAENFRCLCTGERGRGKLSGKRLCFKGSAFHRIISGFMCQVRDRVAFAAGGRAAALLAPVLPACCVVVGAACAARCLICCRNALVVAHIREGTSRRATAQAGRASTG